MSVIFDLKTSDDSWPLMVNHALESYLPEYIEQHGAVGSSLWWEACDKGNIPLLTKRGVVTFLGKRAKAACEIGDIIEIDHDGILSEYDRVAYWQHPEVVVGSRITVKLFEIEVVQKHGVTMFRFERFVEVSN
ncbi:MAG: hypothetical protein COA42_22725 [Alteromonadaceae bacterium]|nr:MAG: hypothetical protein COA42_22725 [Alteromonadaceae bacterium]